MIQVGIFSFTCCEGCQLQILDLGERFSELAKYFDFQHFRLAQEKNIEGKFDIGIVEGSIARKDELEKIKEIRERCTYLITIGACAVSGGVPSLINPLKKSYAKKPDLQNTSSVGKHVKVDYNIRGCPIEGSEFERVLIDYLIGKRHGEINHPVCVECTQRKIDCLFNKGLPCLGPVTAAGCNAQCPENDTACEGCRGIIEDANLLSYKNELKRMGFTEKEIKNKLSRFNEAAK